MKLQIGYGLNTNNDGKVNVVDVNPKLLEKMAEKAEQLLEEKIASSKDGMIYLYDTDMQARQKQNSRRVSVLI